VIKSKFDQKVVVRSYGVICVVRTNSRDALLPIRQLLRRYVPGCEFSKADRLVEHEFFYKWNPSGRDSLFKDDESLGTNSKRSEMLDILGSAVRILIAEYAVGRVFIHAGAVGWKGKAIIIPARSFKGKSALTAEFVRQGAIYYSDEYAVLDKRGFVHPFPKDLSLRGIISDYDQVDHTAEELGGRTGKRPLPVGLILITEYKENAKWKPEIVNAGKGAMELINNAVPIRRDPKFALPILSTVAAGAMIIRSKRGEAAETAEAILKELDKNKW
jgi:hypothetical protein